MFKYIFVLLWLPLSTFAAGQQDDVVETSADWRGLITLAREAYAKKEYQKAMLFYKTALPNIPENIDVADEIAQTQYRLKQFDAASSTYEKRTKGKKEDKSRAYHNLGNIDMQNKSYDKAIESYKNALRNNPTNEQTRYNLSQAIRKKKEQEKQNPPPKDDKDDKDKNKNDKKDDKKDNQKDKKEPEAQDNPSALSDNSVERELDKLMRKEEETKRKLASSKEGKSAKKLSKQW